MKRFFLIAAGLLITACFSIYIFGADLSGTDNHIGHQYDTAAAGIIVGPDDKAAADVTRRPAGAAAAYIENRESPAAVAAADITSRPAGAAAAYIENRESPAAVAAADITGRPFVAPAADITNSPKGTAAACIESRESPVATAAADITDSPTDTAAAYSEIRESPAAALTAAPAQTVGPSGPLSGWELIWADEFADEGVDQKYWTRVDRKNNYNNELQYYLPKNAFTEDGCLCLTAKKEKRKGKKYTSGMAETRGKVLFKYGRVEARAKLPAGKGLFPAIWMLTEDGASEIDIMEMIGSEPHLIYGVNHYQRNGPRKTAGWVTCDTPEEFHVYAAEWDKDEIRWYLDGELFHKSRMGVPSKKMYIVFTLAVGGDWPGDPGKDTPFPSSMKVDYIRVYKRV